MKYEDHPRLWSAAALGALLAIALPAATCSSEPDEGTAPTVGSVTPATGEAGVATPVTIHGTNLAVRLVRDVSCDGNGVGVDDVFDVSLGSSPLEEVLWQSGTTITAVVPATLAPGTYDLELIDPYGRIATLAAAFTVSGGDADGGIDSDSATGADSDGDSDSDTGSDSDSGTDSGTDLDTDVDTDVDTDSDSDADSESDTGSDGDSDTGSDTGSETESETGSETFTDSGLETDPSAGEDCDTPVVIDGYPRNWSSAWSGFGNSFVAANECGSGDKDIWFEVHVPPGSTVTVTELSSSNVVLRELTAPGCGSDECARYIDSPETLTFANVGVADLVVGLIVSSQPGASENLYLEFLLTSGG